MHALILSCFWVVRGQNPGPHACVVNSSPTEDLPSPCTLYSLMGSDKICIIIEACGSLGPQTPGRETSRLRLCSPGPSSLTLSPLPQDMKVPEICYLDLPNVKVFHGSNEPKECTLPHLQTLYFLWLGTSPTHLESGLNPCLQAKSCLPQALSCPSPKTVRATYKEKSLLFVKRTCSLRELIELRAAPAGIRVTRRQESL